MTEKNYYDTLGLKSNASAHEIKMAYRSLAMNLHPDRNLDRDTTLEFQALQEAYAVLGYEKTRKEYDAGPEIFRFVMPERKRPDRPMEKDIQSILRYAKEAFNGLGYFAQMQDIRQPNERKLGRAEMLEDIGWIIEKADELRSPELYVEAASALKLHAVWYCYTYLGEDKKPPLERAVHLLEQAVCIASEKSRPDYEFLLASLLVGKPQVRDLVRARAILDCIKAPKLKKSVDLLLRTIDRWEGTPTIRKEFSYTNVTYIPVGAWFSERTNCRALIKKLKKEKNIEAMRQVLDHLYRVAVLGEACDTIMMASDYDRQDEHIKHLKQSVPLIKQMTFETHGRIVPRSLNNPFLSTNDYKAFELVYGKIDKEFDPKLLLSDELKQRINILTARAAEFRRQNESPRIQ